ncbi:hypothetical protein ACDX78_01065 [Virgibacillus oceani]
MQTNKMAVKKIQRIGNKTIADEMLYKSIYKSLGVKGRVSKKISPDYIRHHLLKKELIYHPFWIVKNLVIAERPPFPSKKMPNVIFIDAVSGYRGLFSKIPPITEEEVEAHALATLRISMDEDVTKYIRNVQEKQINRSYVLKKPKHEVKEITLVYLPIWKAKVKSDELDETFYINGNTGESEKFMSDRWERGKDLLE